MNSGLMDQLPWMLLLTIDGLSASVQRWHTSLLVVWPELVPRVWQVSCQTYWSSFACDESFFIWSFTVLSIGVDFFLFILFRLNWIFWLCQFFPSNWRYFWLLFLQIFVLLLPSYPSFLSPPVFHIWMYVIVSHLLEALFIFLHSFPLCYLNCKSHVYLS